MRVTSAAAGLLLTSLAVLVALPAASAGPVALVDYACDTAVEPLQAECLLECDRTSPLLEGLCTRVDYGGSVWYVCTGLLGPAPACDPSTYQCASSKLLLDYVCREVINPVLERA